MTPTLATLNDEDRYSTTEVKGLLQQAPGFSTGIAEKQVNRLADRLSIALMKIYTLEELKSPQNVRKYLPLIENAFRAPDVAFSAEDRQPRVTLVLLEFVRSHTADQDLKAEISRIEGRIAPKP